MRRQGVGGGRPLWLASLVDADTGIVASLHVEQTSTATYQDANVGPCLSKVLL